MLDRVVFRLCRTLRRQSTDNRLFGTSCARLSRVMASHFPVVDVEARLLPLLCYPDLD
jgi:hypothetical protein